MPNLLDTTSNAVFPRIGLEYTWDDRFALLAAKLDTKPVGGTFGMLVIVVRMYYNVKFAKLYHPINNRNEILPWKNYYSASIPLVISVSFQPSIDPTELSTIDLPQPIPEEIDTDSEDWYGRIYEEKKEQPF